MHIPTHRTASPRARPAGVPGFGQVLTDHLFRAEWTPESGWHEPRVEPYGPLALDPAAAALHYGQTAFEGLKAFRGPDGAARLFRPREHARRMARTAERLCMPAPSEELFVEAVKALVRADATWFPDAPGTSLYLRPLLFANEPFLGVRPARRYLFLVMASPVGGYFGPDARPLRLWVERRWSRAAPGGLGAAKTAGNYAASLLAAEEAKARGFDQVLWTDAMSHRLVEEVGTMNLFARLGSTVVTPPLADTLLAGVTRDAVLALLRSDGAAVEERPLALDELAAAARAGSLAEVFGTGTAAVVAPVGELAWEGGGLRLPDAADGLGARLRARIQAVQRGEAPDALGWMEPV
ncbi:MAG TPA: branched-chain amino acid aminotransferase [Anaeromyxobacteraceae bacterium]|nr:branched-chain amino acid aminotransferase [Anaeromyxobacteraceae bacterium]